MRSLGKIGPYRLIEKIGEGGFGQVYKAEGFGNIVALKIFQPENEASLRQFMDEASITRKLEHPNIVRTIKYDLDGSIFYLAMELLSGSLQDKFDQQNLLPQSKSLSLLTGIASGLEYAHKSSLRKKQVIHRDLKPANILLTEKGIPKIADFGLALFDDSLLKRHHMGRAGTLLYMAPEQLGDSDSVGPSADIYAYALIAYQLFSGQLPYSPEILAELKYKGSIRSVTIEDIISAISSEPPLPITKVNPDLPKGLEKVFGKRVI